MSPGAAETEPLRNATPAGAENIPCWSAIGVHGDQSCPELAAAIHCRNCGVFASAARDFLNRPAPSGYLADWSGCLDDEAAFTIDGSDTLRPGMGVVVFRLGPEWLALPAAVVVEVAPVRPVHRIPHRTSAILAGLVNLRGQLHLCASLHGLLGTAPHAADSPRRRDGAARMIVIRREAEAWVFTADSVVEVPHIPLDALQNVPATLANPAVSFSQSVFDWRGHSVGLLDAARLFDALGSLGQ
jgi:chemotaxis-related protein WspD